MSTDKSQANPPIFSTASVTDASPWSAFVRFADALACALPLRSSILRALACASLNPAVSNPGKPGETARRQQDCRNPNYGRPPVSDPLRFSDNQLSMDAPTQMGVVPETVEFYFRCAAFMPE